MKNQLLILLSISFLALYSCKKPKKKDPNPHTLSSTNVFRLKHDGTLYSTNNPQVSANNIMVGINAGTLGETGNYYQIGLKKNLLPGTYEYSGSMDDPMVFLIISDQLVYTENHGSITVLSNDTVFKRIEFAFTFEMLEDNSHSDTIQIAEGYANVSY